MPGLSKLTASIAFLFAALVTTVYGIADKHVVIVVWDGMRPDFVTEQNTPTLWKLATQGVTFRNHHAVYLSATNVNGTAIATGDYPAHDGIIANREYRPKIDNQKPVDVEAVKVVEKGDAVTNGNYVRVPTIAELVRQSGGRTITAAAKTIGFLQDRDAGQQVGAVHPNRPPGNTEKQAIEVNRPYLKNGGSITLSAGRCWPNESLAPIVKLLGPFPKSHPAKDDWTTKALTDVLWKDGLPPFSVLWLGEPDLTQHETAPGAPAALAAIKSSDHNLAAMLAALDRLNARETTDVFVVSDHGFSTIEHEIDVPKILRTAGFNAVTENPRPDDIMVVGVGGSVLFYVPQHDATLTQRVVDFLQQSDFAGVIFTKNRMEGTFTLDQAKIDSPEAPDIVMAFRWNEARNQFGIPGMIDADWQRAAGKGTHATLSRFDMHNTLIVAGPDFQTGLTSGDDLPSGNVDLAPTILRILGIPPPQMDGRVLTEAMVPVDIRPHPSIITDQASKKFPSGTWRQTLRASGVGSTVYIDEGNGEFTPSGH